MTTIQYSAADLAAALGKPPPTAEQTAVIEAPLEPLLVVAGAGSGKTETMTSRVVWLVANRVVEADEILGLTFTRKAAAELGERVSARLAALRRAGLWEPPVEEGVISLAGAPTVSTYHSYAGRLVGEHALRLGYEPDSRLLSEAAAWQYAHEVVQAWDGPMEAMSKAESTVTKAVVHLSGEMAEHLVTPAEVDDELAAIEATLLELPVAGKARLKAVTDLAAVMAERRLVMPIVARYLELKRERDSMDFGDQMGLAARLADRFPDIGAIERRRFRAVLLDEFQDTSEAQMVLMRSLFARSDTGDGVGVTAVGDPNQSIYAFRGASATTLGTFPSAFPTSAGGPAAVLPLSTSWRNDQLVLDVANRVAAPLRSESAVPVQPLRARPGAHAGQVYVQCLETIDDEAAEIAEWIGHRVAGGRLSAAVLCRRRSQFAPIITALDGREIPYEVVGLGGLLLTSEIEDLVALLSVVQDPSRGDRLMRLLTGPACRLGAADLDGLHAWARSRQRLRQPAQPAAPGPVDLAPDSTDDVSLVEALDDLPAPGWTGPSGERLSAAAGARLAALGEVVRRVRRLTGLPLPDLVGEAERALGLDIEVLTRPNRDVATARVHLDAFADVAAQFAASAVRPTLGGFLDWLAAAEEQEDGLEMPTLEITPGAVQVLTCHASKGLEWDAVAVPGLVEGVFPAHNAKASDKSGFWTLGDVNDSGWLTGIEAVPYGLRGDRAGLPVLDLEAADDKAMVENITAFKQERGAASITEERRLAYVAFTRSRGQLLLSAHLWGDAKTPRLPSRFLDEVRRAVEHEGLPVEELHWEPLPEAGATNPRELHPPSAAQWPVGDQPWYAAHLRRAADDIGATLSGADGAAELLSEDDLDEDLRVLLAERRARRRPGAAVVDLPAHLSTSALIDYAADPEAFAVDLRRPMPRRPEPAARRGTAFHAWVEQHYARAAMVDLTDLPGSADEGAADDTHLPELQAHFLASEWADRVPIELEVPIETMFAGVAVRGRVDAVFTEPPLPDGRPRWVVVDWKTGRPPTGEEARRRALQLATYRVAWARLHDVLPEQVGGAFFYAATGQTVRPDLGDADQIAELISSVPLAGEEP
ncbi:ATP-dependent DNA helicase [Kribbia dieselivorans]|uniref:ATP-dependent DNA helicase n=1 Tax=Kribbia dieselivorans TaxID=331526 RepID=UPI0008381446|nr:ATP-dependent DNA helicase [Kribbia dieselivorans]